MLRSSAIVFLALTLTWPAEAGKRDQGQRAAFQRVNPSEHRQAARRLSWLRGGPYPPPLRGLAECRAIRR